jgi:hypothetical protein
MSTFHWRAKNALFMPQPYRSYTHIINWDVALDLVTGRWVWVYRYRYRYRGAGF